MTKFEVGQMVEMRDTDNFPNYRMIVTGPDDSEFSGVCVSLSTGKEVPYMHVGKLEYDMPVKDWRGITQSFDLGGGVETFNVGDIIYATYGPEYSSMVSEVSKRGDIIRSVGLTDDEAGRFNYYPLACYSRSTRPITFTPIKPFPKIGDLMAGYGLIMIITDVDTGTFTGTVIDSTDGVGLGVVKYNQPISQFHHTPQGQNDR
ncbi:hypothetical protein [Janthinobacterium sp.]|uniref:hypothetical protein n=1 Tax=Janthinobacterium sp. TaxID=1871054 RepID=UPI00260C29D7|nr:hypothetical protein [Janthinobacterium sp.]